MKSIEANPHLRSSPWHSVDILSIIPSLIDPRQPGISRPSRDREDDCCSFRTREHIVMVIPCIHTTPFPYGGQGLTRYHIC